MSAPDLLERTRMALAEAGHPTDIVRQGVNGVEFLVGAIPSVEIWRAGTIARGMDPDQVCWACAVDAYKAYTPDSVILGRRAACLADRPLVRDCGLARRRSDPPAA